MGRRYAIRTRNPWSRYNSYHNDAGARNRTRSDQTSAPTDHSRSSAPTSPSSGQSEPRHTSCPCTTWTVRKSCLGTSARHPDMVQQSRLLAVLSPSPPRWRKDFGCQHLRYSLSHKSNFLNNATTEQAFGHPKKEFYRGRVRLVQAIQGRARCARRPLDHKKRPGTAHPTPEEFRSVSLAT